MKIRVEFDLENDFVWVILVVEVFLLIFPENLGGLLKEDPPIVGLVVIDQVGLDVYLREIRLDQLNQKGVGNLYLPFGELLLDLKLPVYVDNLNEVFIDFHN